MADVDHDSDVSDEEAPGIEDQDVVTKYKEAARIANEAITAVGKAAVDGMLVVELCKLGDGLLEKLAQSIFKSKKEMKKGIAYPTCVSVNNCVCANSPLDGNDAKISDGDMLKIDLGCHVDGYIATVAGTVVVGASAASPVTGKAADVLAAAYQGAELMMRMVRPGDANTAIPEMLAKVAEAYGVSVVEGVLSHEMKRYCMDGENCILARTDKDQKVELHNFEVGEVYHLDVAMSTGDGKTREVDEKQRTVFKRASDEMYSLKMKASRMVFNTIKTKYPDLPFALRYLGEDARAQSRARLGMTELMKHEMVHPYPVLFEKEGESVAHVKYTVLQMPSGLMKITGVGSPALSTDCSIEDDEVKAILARSIGKKKKKRAKKKKAAVSAD